MDRGWTGFACFSCGSSLLCTKGKEEKKNTYSVNCLMIWALILFLFLFVLQRRHKDISVPFHKHVCRFLSETSLALIAERNNLLDQQAFASPIHLPSSCLSCFISATSNKKVACVRECDWIYFYALRWFCIQLTAFGSFGLVFQVIDRTFGASPGSYWQTVETQEYVCKGRESTAELHTEVSTLPFRPVLCSGSCSC